MKHLVYVLYDEVQADVMTERPGSSPTADLLEYVQQRQETLSVPNDADCVRSRVSQLVRRCG